MTTDIHSKSFDEGTRIKLELFKLYLKSWIPVFIERNEKSIEIHDFFAGEGTDALGIWGSPLIILDSLKPYCSKLINKTNLLIHFNDVSKKKIALLENKVKEKLIVCSESKMYGFCNNTNSKSNCPFQIEFNHKDFSDIFSEKYLDFKLTPKTPRFIFLDQYGIKQVNTEVFKQLTCLDKTDFMFFISTSHIMRFKEMPEFKKYIENIEFSEKKPSECHRVIYEYYKSKLNGKDYFLGQFSIKKNSNYYGIIFGSNNHLGLKKFLDAAWKIDPHTGETNHDIDGDPIRHGQTTLDLFGDGTQNQVKKLVVFENELKKFLEYRKSNKDIYRFALEKGICISKTNDILRSLEQKNLITFFGERRKGAFYLDNTPDKKIYIQTVWQQPK
jgi:three-Cys-motif partner protein